MTVEADRIWQWPALRDGDEFLSTALAVERAVWGKVHGQASDYRLIAKSPGFAEVLSRLPAEMNLGSEDDPRSAACWRAMGDRCYAIGMRKSDATDASGRTGFVEKQIISWVRPAGCPAAVGALLLLPQVCEWWSRENWGVATDSDWADPEFCLALPEDDHAPVLVDAKLLAEAIDVGLEALMDLGETALTELYSDLLAGGKALPIRDLAKPLPVAAVAALLLPCERDRADTMSIAGWIPSSRFALDSLAARWDIAAGSPAATDPERLHTDPSSDERALADRMMRSVSNDDPSILRKTSDAEEQVVAAPGIDPLRLVMWGASASGKTALIALMYLKSFQNEYGDWAVFPQGKTTREFIEEAQRRIQTESRFPKATAIGQATEITYSLRNSATAAKAVLSVEDRAGGEYEGLAEQAKRRLQEAHGLAMLLDPDRDQTQTYQEVSKTLLTLHDESRRVGESDPRPLAVCLAKADTLIRSARDMHDAISEPISFTKRHLPDSLLNLISQYFPNCSFFPISSVGLEARWGAIERVAFFDEALEPRLLLKGTPINIIEPFKWLIEQCTLQT